MRLLNKIPSRERCTESGWDAYDYFLDMPMDEAFIRRFQPLGSFLYMSALREPFFKVESDCYVIKGVKNRDVFRIAVHRDSLRLLDDIEQAVGLRAK